MHDCGGADIPLVVTDWKSEDLDRALDYWVELSKGEWSASEQRDKCNYALIFFQDSLIPINLVYEIDNSWCLKVKPCFLQVDLLVRALLSDPATEYVPRFIVFMSTARKAKARVLFTDPSFSLPEMLSESYPTGCGGTNCEDPDCGFFDFSACRSLAPKSKIVRQDNFPRGVARCNLWICTVEEPAGHTGHSKFKTCQRCAEVLYCSQEHQVCSIINRRLRKVHLSIFRE